MYAHTSRLFTYTHTHPPSHIRTNPGTYAHSQSSTPSHVCTHILSIHVRTQPVIYTQSHTHKPSHVCRQSVSQVHPVTYAHTRRHMYTQSRTHTASQVRTSSQSRTPRHVRTHSQSRTHVRTRTRRIILSHTRAPHGTPPPHPAAGAPEGAGVRGDEPGSAALGPDAHTRPSHTVTQHGRGGHSRPSSTRDHTAMTWFFVCLRFFLQFVRARPFSSLR